MKSDRDYLEKLYNSIGEVIFTVKLPERVIQHVNSAVAETLGYSPDECIDKSTEMFYPEKAGYLEFGNNTNGVGPS